MKCLIGHDSSGARKMLWSMRTAVLILEPSLCFFQNRVTCFATGLRR